LYLKSALTMEKMSIDIFFCGSKCYGTSLAA
jgi:hypothetical protein